MIPGGANPRITARQKLRERRSVRERVSVAVFLLEPLARPEQARISGPGLTAPDLQQLLDTLTVDQR